MGEQRVSNRRHPGLIRILSEPRIAPFTGAATFVVSKIPRASLSRTISILIHSTPNPESSPGHNVMRDSPTFVTGIHSAGAINTVRMIYLDEQVRPEEVGLAGCATPADCEHEFRVTLESGGGFDQLDKVVYDGYGAAGTRPFGGTTLVTLAHEYGHWTIVNGTSMSTAIEAYAWRLRVLRLLLCETIHQRTGIYRRASQENAEKLRAQCSVFQERLRVVSHDPVMESLYRDLVSTQHRLLFVLQPVLSILLEPVTWALVEEQAKRRSDLGNYFNAVERPIAEGILDASEDFLRGHTRRELVLAARSALNLPPEEFSLIADSEVAYGQHLVEERFGEVVKGRWLPEASVEGVTFMGALGSGLAFQGKALDLLLDASRNIISRERILFGYLITMIARSMEKPVDSWPTVMVNTRIEGKPLKLRYDWLTWLTAGEDRKSPIANRTVRATGEPLNTLDDVVGHLPPTLQMPAIMLFYQSFAATEKEKVQDRLLQLGSGIKNRQSYESYLRYAAIVAEFLAEPAYREELTYGQLAEADSFERYLMFWFRFVTDLGASAKYLYLEHGVGS